MLVADTEAARLFCAIMMIIEANPSRRGLLTAIGNLGDEAYDWLRTQCIEREYVDAVSDRATADFKRLRLAAEADERSAAAAAATAYQEQKQKQDRLSL